MARSRSRWRSRPRPRQSRKRFMQSAQEHEGRKREFAMPQTHIVLALLLALAGTATGGETTPVAADILKLTEGARTKLVWMREVKGFASGRVETWRGGVGEACLFPALSSAGASIASPCSVSSIPLIEPDVRISRIRLSDKVFMPSPTGGCGRAPTAGSGPGFGGGKRPKTAADPARPLGACRTTTAEACRGRVRPRHGRLC